MGSSMTTAAAFPWKAEETAPSGSAPFYRADPRERPAADPLSAARGRDQGGVRRAQGAGLPLSREARPRGPRRANEDASSSI